MTTSENWQFNKSAVECHKYMLDHKIATDVTFLVSYNSGKEDAQGKHVEATRFDAHRFALISRSPVFYAMLCGEIAESKEIIVNDVEPEAFQEMLNFVYTDEVNLKPEIVMFVLYASKKYMLSGLTAKCTEYLENQLDASNACTILDQSLHFEEEELAVKAMKIIQHQTKDSLETPYMMDIRQLTLEHILESNFFSANEIDIFSACIKWATNQCKQHDIEANGPNMRNLLKSCIQKLRFPTMTLEEIGKSVSPTNVLTKDEELDIFRYLSFKDSTPPPEMFNSVSRYYKPPFIMRDLEDLVQRHYTHDTLFSIAFTCNFDFKLKSLLVGSMPTVTQNLTKRQTRSFQHQCTFFSVDGQNISVSKGSLEGKAVWIIPGKTFAIKKGDHSFMMRFGLSLQPGLMGPSSAPLFIINKKTLVLKDENLATELTLTSGRDTLPICGIRYEL